MISSTACLERLARVAIVERFGETTVICGTMNFKYSKKLKNKIKKILLWMKTCNLPYPMNII